MKYILQKIINKYIIYYNELRNGNNYYPIKTAVKHVSAWAEGLSLLKHTNRIYLLMIL